jgi:hypothetical protein
MAQPDPQQNPHAAAGPQPAVWQVTGGYPTQPGPYAGQPGSYPTKPNQPGYPPTGSYPTHQGYPGYGTGNYPVVGGHEPPKGGYPVRNGMLVGIAALAIVGTALVLILSNRKPAEQATPPPPISTSQQTQQSQPTGPSAAEQASLIDQLLAESELGRNYLGAAINDIDACRITSTMYGNLNLAISNRASLMNRTDALEVYNIPEGATIKSELRTVFAASHDADLAYLNWAQAAGSFCPQTSDYAYQAVVAANNVAQADKDNFVAYWNPVAARYGLPQRSSSQI